MHNKHNQRTILGGDIYRTFEKYWIEMQITSWCKEKGTIVSLFWVVCDYNRCKIGILRRMFSLYGSSYMSFGYLIFNLTYCFDFHCVYIIKICQYFRNTRVHIRIIILQLFKSIILYFESRKEILLQTMSRWSDYNIQIMSIATNTQSLSICGSVSNAINVGNRKSRARFINCTQLQNIHQQ